MAAGLPAIYTPWSGVTEYCDKTIAYPLKYSILETEIDPNMPEDWPDREAYCLKAEVAVADIEDICNRLIWVWQNYPKAQAKAMRAMWRMKAEYTWAHTGRRLRAILEEVSPNGGKPTPVHGHRS